MSNVEISGAQYPLHKVFSSDFVFTIPPYQRPYAWKTEHATALVEDLLTHMGDSNEPLERHSPYFLGTIVLIKTSGPDSEVVDGQQRLTTLTILLSVLRQRVSREVADGLTKRLYDPADALLGTANRYRLTLRKEDAEFFRTHIQAEGGLADLPSVTEVLDDSKANLRNNAIAIQSVLASLEPDRCELLARFIISRCYVVVVSTTDFDAAYRIFSILNDRGLDLSHTDILKSEIIGAIPEADRDTYTDKWVTEETELGRSNFDALFGHIRMIHAKVKAKTTILKAFRDSVAPTKNPRHFIDQVLVPMASAFHDVLHASYESTSKADKINDMLRWLGRVENADWVPPAISFLSRHRGDPARVLTFLTDLERLAAYLMISRANVNDRIERYAEVLLQIEADSDVHAAGSALQLAEFSQAQNFDFDRKKHEYFGRNGVSPFALTTQVLSKAEWTPSVVDNRQQELIGRLASVWRLV